MTSIGGNEALLWDISELPDDLPRIECLVKVRTGLVLDEEGNETLDELAWREQRERLASLGGVPENAEPRWRLDPILFGLDPTARAKAWIAQKRWAEAETAYDEVVAARPLDTAVLFEAPSSSNHTRHAIRPSVIMRRPMRWVRATRS